MAACSPHSIFAVQLYPLPQHRISCSYVNTYLRSKRHPHTFVSQVFYCVMGYVGEDGTESAGQLILIAPANHCSADHRAEVRRENSLLKVRNAGV